MLAFPALPVLSEPLSFRLGNAREHAHLHNNLARISSRHRLNRTTQAKTVSTRSQNPLLATLWNWSSILPIRRAKVPKHTIATPRSFVVVVLQRAVAVFDVDFTLVEEHVRSDVAAGYLAAVGARAEVAARFGEEVFGSNGGTDAAAETAACHAVGETCWVVLFGVAGEGRHDEFVWFGAWMQSWRNVMRVNGIHVN